MSITESQPWVGNEVRKTVGSAQETSAGVVSESLLSSLLGGFESQGRGGTSLVLQISGRAWSDIMWISLYHFIIWQQRFPKQKTTQLITLISCDGGGVQDRPATCMPTKTRGDMVCRVDMSGAYQLEALVKSLQLVFLPLCVCLALRALGEATDIGLYTSTPFLSQAVNFDRGRRRWQMPMNPAIRADEQVTQSLKVRL
jgi:hypothetical protein